MLLLPFLSNRFMLINNYDQIGDFFVNKEIGKVGIKLERDTILTNKQTRSGIRVVFLFLRVREKNTASSVVKLSTDSNGIGGNDRRPVTKQHVLVSRKMDNISQHEQHRDTSPPPPPSRQF